MIALVPYLISYLLSIVAVQASILSKILYDAATKRKKIKRRIIQVREIIPQIKRHPNPHLAIFLWKFGNDLSMDDDPCWKFAGPCLKNYYTLLLQHVKKEYLNEDTFIHRAQKAMSKLKEAFQQDSKKKLAESLFELSSLIYEYPSFEEDFEISKKLEKTLSQGISYLRNKDRTIRSSHELDLFINWSFHRLKKANSYLRFIFIHTVGWCSQLPFEYKIGGRAFLKKSEKMANAVEKALHLAKSEDLLGIYMVLSSAYTSVFSIAKQREFFSEEAFFRPKSSLERVEEETLLKAKMIYFWIQRLPKLSF